MVLTLVVLHKQRHRCNAVARLSLNYPSTKFDGFFRDLCKFIALNTRFEWKDNELAYRDRKNMNLGEPWKPGLREALEVSSVFVCLASPGYLSRAFCGKEFYVFDQRIRKYAGIEGAAPTAIVSSNLGTS